MPAADAVPSDEAPITSLPRTGWFNEVAGPINALVALRGTWQNERNSLVLDLFSKQFLQPGQAHEPGTKVYFVQFIFDAVDQSVSPPLSWKLNERQDRQIDAVWTQLEDLVPDRNSPLAILDGYFRPVPAARMLGPAGQKGARQ